MFLNKIRFTQRGLTGAAIAGKVGMGRRDKSREILADRLPRVVSGSKLKETDIPFIRFLRLAVLDI